jgi:hypothetical protein
MKILYFLFILLPFLGNTQLDQALTAEERAYLFHVVKKSPILNNNFGRFFDYKGPDIRLPNKDVNFDSLELVIINSPELLIIRTEEIAKSSKGLLSEAANKMALWELNKVLLAKRGNDKDLEQYQNEYNRFVKILIEVLPPAAMRQENGVLEPQPKLFNVINPGLSFDDRAAMLSSFRFLSLNDQLTTNVALNKAINKYVELRTFEIFQALGGRAEEFSNVLIAAGDGSETSGVLNEREKDEKGRWNKGLPKAIGLFPYQAVIIKGDKKRNTRLEPLRYPTLDFKTVGNNLMTNIHCDVWGYNSSKQTTVVIEKNGKCYPLFGSGETRFLSPDSSFAEGATFQSIINELKNGKIAKLNDLIYGKKGFDYWIEYYKKKKDETELRIEKEEKKHSDYGYKKITTKKKASRAVKKAKKKAIGYKDNYQPTTKSQKKKRGNKQVTIVDLYNMYDEYKRLIAENELMKSQAIDELAILQHRLDEFNRLFGVYWVPYTEKDGLYTFADSTTFDLLTQEFTFQASKEKENFEIRLLSIPESCLSESNDEVMLHVSVMDLKPNYDARLQLELTDVFASDKWDLNQELFTIKDSVALMQLFEALEDKDKKLSIVARGQGIGEWNGVRTIKKEQAVEESTYKGSRMDSSYVRLRKSELFVQLNRDILIEVNSYTDPVVSNIQISNEQILALMSKYKLSKNDVLSAYRTWTIMQKLKEEVNVAAGMYLPRSRSKAVIDRFNKEWSKVKISMGATSIKMSDM